MTGARNNYFNQISDVKTDNFPEVLKKSDAFRDENVKNVPFPF